ncbi:MAG TPA: type II secretion system protein [Geopsychrobacteraceae bacterium]|nr:type II secretion system protein [Geopsychrobacteraceae bacterium]
MSDFRSAFNLPVSPVLSARVAGNQRGGVLLFLLVAVTILGLSVGIAGSTWTSMVQRAKEEDLLWKGNQIAKAIGSYYQTKGAPGKPLVYPRSVDQLLKDNRSLSASRHLRKPYLDPMTGEDWEWIKAPEGGLKGVRSTSQKKPFKMDGFREENKSFAGMWQYRDWEFIYQPPKTAAKKTATPNKTGVTTPGTTSPGVTPPATTPPATTQ